MITPHLFQRLTAVAFGVLTLTSGASAIAVHAQVAPTATSAAGTVYIVEPGDTLVQIGLKYGLSYQALAAANGIVNPDQIIVGQQLTIPTGGVTGTPAPSLTPSVTLPVFGGPSAPTTYTVQPGDVLYKIAAQFNTSVLLLAQLNNIGNVNLIYVGETIKLPVNGTAGNIPAATATSATMSTSVTAVTVPTTIPSPAVTTPAPASPTIAPTIMPTTAVPATPTIAPTLVATGAATVAATSPVTMAATAVPTLAATAVTSG